MTSTGRDREGLGTRAASDLLYFFPEHRVTRGEATALLAHGTPNERAWVISHLLRYAQWEDIWELTTRDEVRELFPLLDLPENLRQKWARMLKVETVVAP